ncbi:MAG: hypothetical protein ACNS64_03990 [Candidatus Halalkalibacterium sp. M3_1C_030]
MKTSNIFKLILILAALLTTFIAYGCSTSKEASGGDGLGDLGSFEMEKSGAVLWGENCGRCHNAPDPTAFSDVQWEAIGAHMRVRAGLTADETNKIVTFLKQSN